MEDIKFNFCEVQKEVTLTFIHHLFNIIILLYYYFLMISLNYLQILCQLKLDT